uniref:F-box domain-containing protein n=1 Tax=Panagrolaimus superbus TaxID=310955 RepID=A0A914Y2K0_9BILA
MFNYPALPQLVQEKIISEICDKCHPKDAQNFALSSKLNYFMFKKCNRERTEIQQLPLMIGGDIYLYLTEMRDLNSDEEVLKYISRLSIIDSLHIEFCTQQPASTEILHRVMPYIVGTARYAKTVYIYITYEFSKEHEKEFIYLLRSLKSAERLHISLVKLVDGEPFNINPLINSMYQIKSIQ